MRRLRHYSLDAKYARLHRGGANPFIDPEGCKQYVAEREEAFRAELQRQQAAAAR